MKKVLSIFIDESGDFGQYEAHCPYYLVTFVFHDQKIDVKKDIAFLNNAVMYLNIPNDYIHTGPIIRKEDNYYSLSLDARRKALSLMLTFIRKAPIVYHTFAVDRRLAQDPLTQRMILSKQFNEFFDQNNELFNKFDIFKVYYDNGQRELTKTLSSILPLCVKNDIEWKFVEKPSDYKLFQAADFICSIELIHLKSVNHQFKKTEVTFFKTEKQFASNYYQKVKKKSI